MSWIGCGISSGSEGGRGSSIVTTLVAVATGFVVLLLCVELVLVAYARSAVRSALDDAVRAGSRADATVATCLARGEDVLAGLLGGPLGRGVSLQCREDGTDVVAEATVVIDGLLPGVPAWGPMRMAASAHKEPFAP